MTQLFCTLCLLVCVPLLSTSAESHDARSNKQSIARQVWFSGRDPSFLRNHDSAKPTYNGNNNYHPHGAPSSTYVEQLERQRQDQHRSVDSSGIISSSSGRTKQGSENSAVGANQNNPQEDTYDPFFFFSRSKSASSHNYNSNNHIVNRPRYHSRYYGPSSAALQSSIRSRRNSRRRDYFNNGDEISGSRYNILTPQDRATSPYPAVSRYETAASVNTPDYRDRNPYNILSKSARLRNNNNHHLHDHHNRNKGVNQFLSYDEIFNQNGVSWDSDA